MGVELGEMLATLGPTVAEPLHAPEHVVITATVIEDAADALPLTPGGLLLLVGIASDDEAAAHSVKRAALARFSAVAIKRRDRDVEVVIDAARTTGLAVIAASDEIAWRQFDALISSLISSGGDTRPDQLEQGEGDELFSVANAIAAVVGGSVAIEDLSQQVLGYSNIPGQRIDALRRQGILDRRVPPGPDDIESYRRVLTADGVVRFPQMGEELARAAIGIRAGTVPLGTIWAIEGEAGFGAQAERALIDGAQLAALHMLRARSSFDLDQLRRGELLRALLDATAMPDSTWPRLGFTPGDKVAIIALAPSSLPQAASTLITQVAREVSRICHVLRPDAPVTTTPRAVYVLVAGPDPAAAALRLARRIVADTTRTLYRQLRAGVSAEGVGPRSIASLRDEVDQIMRIVATRPEGPNVATLADVQSAVLLTHLGEELARHPELRHPALTQLIELDRESGTELSRSLLVWLEEQQNVQRAAARLHVHHNTLRYRLRRIRELVPIDLDDGDQRLAAWLELRQSVG